jgi:hypothetical protein
MPRMSGCRRYRALCGNPATVVQQCKATPPLPKALTTKQVGLEAAPSPQFSSYLFLDADVVSTDRSNKLTGLIHLRISIYVRMHVSAGVCDVS